MRNAHVTNAIELIAIGPAGRLPNNAALPLAIYRAVLPRDGDTADHCETLFKRHRWRSVWRNGIYNYTTSIRTRMKCWALRAAR